jgi:hypothetical protein
MLPEYVRVELLPEYVRVELLRLREDLAHADAGRQQGREVIERHHRDFNQIQSLVNGGLRTGEHEAALRLIGNVVGEVE